MSVRALQSDSALMRMLALKLLIKRRPVASVATLTLTILVPYLTSPYLYLLSLPYLTLPYLYLTSLA